MRRRRVSLALALVAFLGVVWTDVGGCRRKTAKPAQPAMGPTFRRAPTYIPPTPRPGQVWPTLRPEVSKSRPLPR